MNEAEKFDFIVCKPCWELKYCPYGPMVEHYPLGPAEREMGDVRKSYETALDRVRSGELNTEAEILGAIDQIEFNFPPRWESIKRYDTSDLECNVFGHVCPVFFNAEPLTETKELRRRGRYIPREIMLRVVRRDGQICQDCHKNVPDNEIEFDHLIPKSRGGPVTVENLRVLCRDCNKTKGDSLTGLLREKGDLADFFPPPVDPGSSEDSE